MLEQVYPSAVTAACMEVESVGQLPGPSEQVYPRALQTDEHMSLYVEARTQMTRELPAGGGGLEETGGGGRGGFGLGGRVGAVAPQEAVLPVMLYPI